MVQTSAESQKRKREPSFFFSFFFYFGLKGTLLFLMSHHDFAELGFLCPSSFRQNFFLLGFRISAKKHIKNIFVERHWITAAACEGFTVDENMLNNPKKGLLHFSQSLTISLFCTHPPPPAPLALQPRRRFHVSFSPRHNRHGAFGSLGLDFQIKPAQMEEPPL